MAGDWYNIAGSHRLDPLAVLFFYSGSVPPDCRCVRFISIGLFYFPHPEYLEFSTEATLPNNFAKGK